MTRYTNSGRKRTYLQASFDPNVHENLTTAAAQDSSDAQQEVMADAWPEPNRKCQRTGCEEKLAAESSTAVVKNDGDDKPVVKSEKTKKALAKLKAKEKAKRAKSTLSYLMKKGYCSWALHVHLHRQSRCLRSATLETQGRPVREYDVLRLSRSRALRQGLPLSTAGRE